MAINLIFFAIIFNSLLPVFAVVQEWEFEKSSINLFASSNIFSVVEYEKQGAGIYVKLTKEFTKETSGSITYKKNLIVARGFEDNVYVGEVDFDKIESIYFFDNDYIVCPRGKYHPHYFYDGTYSTLNLPSFKSNGDWELKCYYHSTGFFWFFT